MAYKPISIDRQNLSIMGILRNKETIEDYKLLVNYESFKCSERLE
jgi:hypothetical protein